MQLEPTRWSPVPPHQDPRPPGREWKVGTTLRAVVLSTGPGDRALLGTAGGSLSARGANGLAVGETLRLRVEQNGPQPRLRIEQRGVDAEPPAQRALRAALPRQEPLARALGRLAVTLRDSAASLPPGIASLARTLLGALPRGTTLVEPEALARALRDSGVFLEARLAASPGAVATDFDADLKANLLRLLAAVRRAPRTPASATGAAQVAPQPGVAPPHSTVAPLRQLGVEIDAALQRIQAHQLCSLASREPGPAGLRLELPLRGDGPFETLELRIERDRSSTGSDSERAAGTWRVHLRLEVPGLGPLHARVALSCERVTAGLWAEQSHALELVRAQLPQLRQSLETCGLSVAALVCHSGAPATEHEPQPTSPLLSARA